jgi:hypothetical protein
VIRRLLPAALCAMFLAAGIAGVAACSSKPTSSQTHKPKKKPRVEPTKKKDPDRKKNGHASKPRHDKHEHAHGAHPHGGGTHHHHAHPHPHLSGPNGHHHAY